MTYTNWTGMPDTDKTRKLYPQLSPNLQAGLHFLLTVFSWGPSLTSIANSVRPIRGGSRPSAHNKGAALDVRYYTMPPGGVPRSFIDREVRPSFLAELDILIENADKLGIQQIHDYYGDRIWKNNRDESVDPGGWRDQNGRGSGMGESWATYVHIEVNADKWHDDTPWDQVILDTEPEQDLPRFNPEAHEYGLWPLNPSKPVVANGSRGDAVRYAQAVLGAVSWVSRGRIASPGPIDGRAGAMTENSIRSFQFDQKLTVDGRCGRNTWAKIDAAATVFGR